VGSTATIGAIVLALLLRLVKRIHRRPARHQMWWKAGSPAAAEQIGGGMR
jgi:hypothetical protein